jgi:hypothetical protein
MVTVVLFNVWLMLPPELVVPHPANHNFLNVHTNAIFELRSEKRREQGMEMSKLTNSQF